MQAQTWRKSSYSTEHDGSGTCVELADLGHGLAGIRDSKHPDSGHLTLTHAALSSWIHAVAATNDA